MITIVEQGDGAFFSLRVQPGARKNGVKGEQAGALKLAVTAPPEDGRANAAVIELLAKLLDVKRSQLEIVSGLTSRNKKMLVRGYKAEQLLERLTALISQI